VQHEHSVMRMYVYSDVNPHAPPEAVTHALSSQDRHSAHARSSEAHRARAGYSSVLQPQ
jgi:hypothetical protein